MSVLSILLYCAAGWVAWPWLVANGLQWAAVLLMVAKLFDDIADAVTR